MFQNKNESAVKDNILFKGVSVANLNFNFNQKYFIEVGEGEIIYKSGDPSDYLYLVIEGEIKIKLPGGVSSPFILKKSNNDFFGEKEVQENSIRKSSAVADKNSLLYTIRKIDLTSMAQRSKDLRYNLMGDVKEDIETELNKKETVFDGLMGKLSEQTFFQSENNKLLEQKADAEQEVPGNNGTELNFEDILPDTSESKKSTTEIHENIPEMEDTVDVESINYNYEMLDIPIKTENEKSDQGITRLQMPSLINTIEKMFSDLNPENIFVSIPEAISELLNVKKTILYIINNEVNEFRTRIKSENEYSDFSLKIQGNSILEALNGGKLINLNHPSDEQLTLLNPISDEEVKNLLMSPIMDDKDNIIGILQLININKEGFDSEDEKLITELSPLVALALENSAYVQDLLHADRLISLNKAANFLINDIKNPIVTIKQYIEHIKKQDISKEANLVLDMIIEQANCAVDLVQTTLAYSEGKLISNPQPILLTNALNYILSMLAEYVESRNVKLFKKFEGDGLVNLDKKEFYQACFQIAKNACDAMPQGGNFYIITKRDEDKIRIELKDNGLGIPENIKDRIFEPFMTHGKKQKSGLGLAIAEKIIKEHNGVIWAESNPGGGAVLIIALPVLDLIQMDYNAITILGPTAVGKTRLAVQIAYHYNGEIISADSRQVYKGMNLGTGKDYEDYIIDNHKIPYYLIDIISPTEEFNVFLYKDFFNKAVSQITEREKLPVLCGGTGLYLSAVMQNYKLNQRDINIKKELEKLSFDELKSLFLLLNKSPHNTTDLLDKNRTITALMILQSGNDNYSDTSALKSFTIGINPGREEIKRRISNRLKIRLDSGMIEEVKLLMDDGIGIERMISLGLEYKYIALYLTGKLRYNDMLQQLNSAIHGFAKKQMTWYRKMEKNGIRINWIDSNDFLKAKVIIDNAGFRSI